MIDWSIYTLFVLNRASERDFLQIKIFIYVCSKWNIVELKTRFDTWIRRNDVKGVSLFNRSYLIIHIAYLCSERTQNVQIKYFRFVWSIYTIFVLNREWKRDSLQIMVFVYVCSTWSIVELKTRLETWITRNYLNGVSLFNLSYLITLMTYLCSQGTGNVQIEYFMFDWSIYTHYLC
jgi:hypothetical protein